MKKIILFVLVSIFFIGCGRESFEPQVKFVSKPIIVTKTIKEPIIYLTRKEVTLENGEVLPDNKKLPKGFVAIDKNLSKKGSVLRVNGKNINFKTLIVTAKKRGNLLAIIFSDNHFELYNLDTKKVISNENFGQILALRKFIAQPYFYKELLLIPTLNGKMEIYDLTENKIIRSIVISQKDYFNNIIYLGVKNDNLIVASRDNLIVISPQMVVNKNYNIKHILVDNSGIYIFTIEGKVVKLNFELKVLKEKNFKYASIVFPMFYQNKIYFLVKGSKSFLVKLDKNLNNYSVNALQIKTTDECVSNILFLDKDIFGSNGTYYIGDYYLKLK